MALIAGEASGDALGAGLIAALRELEPGIQIEGVAGPAMVSAGCGRVACSERLAVMGLVEVLSHLPDLLMLRRGLYRRWAASQPDVFIGIDAPDFNLRLARQLRGAGVRTVQYVSPQFWAWRQGRVKKMARSSDLVLCLLPFEKRIYDEHGVAAEYVGHPLADRIPMTSAKQPARERLGLTADGPVVALLPGSRRGEAKRLGDDFAGCVRWLAERRPGIRFVAPMANPGVRALFAGALERAGVSSRVLLCDGRSQEAITAADVVLLASGTATLETMLVKRRMVVAYRVASLTRWVMHSLGLLKVTRYSMPNLLAGRDLVPEIMQDAVSPQSLGEAVLRELDDPGREHELSEVFSGLHRELRRDASRRAAAAVLASLVSAHPPTATAP